MQHPWPWAGAGGLIGGVVGAGLAIALTRSDAPTAEGVRQADPAELQALESKLIGRLEKLERSVRELESGRPPALAARKNVAAAAPEQRQTPAPIDDPVFETAVLDILERAEEGRDSERDVRRNERARQRAEYWANELGMRLALSPAQAAKLLDVRMKLDADLRAQRQRQPEGTFVPRDQRRAAADALRESAERELREVLDHRQLTEYENLAPDLKLLRPDD